MKFEINDTVIDDATAEDIRRALRDRNRDGDFFFGLSTDDDNAIDAEWFDGKFQVTLTEKGQFYDADRPLADIETSDLFVKYLAGDERWREIAVWTVWPETQASVPASKGAGPAMPAFLKRLPPWALALLVLPAMFIFPLFFEALVGLFARVTLPTWLDSTPARIFLGFFTLVVLLIGFATIVKVREVRAAAKWPKTSGRIIRSQPGFDLIQRSREDMPANERIADIVYEYEVGGKTYRASRFTLAEKVAPEDVAGILERFPEGKSVDVFYDPANPQEATIDRDMPGLGRGCLIMFLVGLSFVAVAMVAVTRGPDIIQRGLPNAIVPLMAIFGLGGLVMTLVGWNLVKSGFAARNWPKTMGRVTISDVHGFETVETRSNTSSSYSRTYRRKGHMPVVEYEYGVAGRTFKSRHVKLDSEVGGSKSFAEGIAAKYPVGKIVTVRYDPANPERAYLELSMWAGWFVLALGGLLLVAALWAAGLFTEGPPLKVRR